MPDSNWIDKIIVDRDEWRMKAMDVANHPVVKLLISERDELRTRLNRIEGLILESSHQGCEWSASDLRVELMKVLKHDCS